MKTVLTYHTVPARSTSKAALEAEGAKLASRHCRAATIKVDVVSKKAQLILADEDSDDVNPFLVRSKFDIEASNGIAHGISFVLRPADL